MLDQRDPEELLDEVEANSSILTVPGKVANRILHFWSVATVMIISVFMDERKMVEKA